MVLAVKGGKLQNYRKRTISFLKKLAASLRMNNDNRKCHSIRFDYSNFCSVHSWFTWHISLKAWRETLVMLLPYFLLYSGTLAIGCELKARAIQSPPFKAYYPKISPSQCHFCTHHWTPGNSSCLKENEAKSDGGRPRSLNVAYILVVKGAPWLRCPL